jgi:hypothetical protein
MLGYFVCFGSVKIPSSLSWRLPLILQCITGTIFFLSCLFIPHSPRWLQHVGRERDAAEAWAKLGYSPSEAEKEQEASARVEQGEGRVRRANVVVRKEKWWEVGRALWDRNVRGRTALGCFLMAMQQVGFCVTRSSAHPLNPLAGLWYRWRSLCKSFRAVSY